MLLSHYSVPDTLVCIYHNSDMLPYGTHPGPVTGSSCYNNKVMAEDDMMDFFERVERGRPPEWSSDSHRRLNSRVIHLQM